MSAVKKNFRLILGIILFILGIVFVMIPFLPFGYAFLFVAAFFLATYIPALQKVVDFLKKKDKKGRLDGIEEKIQKLEDMLPDGEVSQKSHAYTK